MRVLMLHNLPPWDPRAGGGQRVQHELATHVAAAGHEVVALFLGDAADARPTPYRVVWVKERGGGRARLAANAVAVARAVRALARDWRPDVVHASAAEGGLLPFVLPPGVGLVATSHHPDPPPLPTDLPWSAASLATLRRLQAPYLEAHLLRSAHRIVAVSRWGVEVLRARGYIPLERPAAVVPNGVAGDWLAAPKRPEGLPSPHAAPDVLFVGRLEPAKGWDVLLDALGRAELGPTTAALAGTGPDEADVRARAAAAGLSGRVRVLGWLDREAVAAQLAGARSLVLPSRRENYPLVLLEAMAAGVPVVATRVGGVAEMIEDGASGLLVPTEDPAALAVALRRVLDDETLRARLAAGGRAVAERHRWDRVALRMTEEYHLARELARPIPRAPTSPASRLLRGGAARVAAARAPRARGGPPPRDVARIALLRPGRLGDLLLTDPLVQALAERWPGAAIEIVTDAADRVPPWLLEDPVRQRTLALRQGGDGWLRPGAPERRASLAALTEAWRGAPPDALLFAVDLADPVLRAAAADLAAAAPGAWRAGLASPGVDVPEVEARVDPGPPMLHESERLLRLAAAAGADGRFRLARVPAAASPLPDWPGPTVVIHPGASRSTRKWPLARWGELARRLARDGARIVAVGDRSERPDAPALDLAFDERSFVDRIGALDLTALAGLMRGAHAFVGNDSFPFHLAVAAGLPALVLIGPGAARFTAYPLERVRGLREPVLCSPRHGEECPVYTTCPHAACMQSIRPDSVERTLRDVLELTRADAS